MNEQKEEWLLPRSLYQEFSQTRYLEPGMNQKQLKMKYFLEWNVKCCYGTGVDQQCLLAENNKKALHKHNATNSIKKAWQKWEAK